MSQSKVLPLKLTVAQLLIQFPVFSRTRGLITIFTTAWLTPSHPIPLVQLPSVLTYIPHWITELLGTICLVHFKHHAHTTKCLITHSFYTTQPFTFLPSIILIISGGRYNLWSYTLCSFLKLPTTFSHKILKTEKHCSQTQSTVYSQCHRTGVIPTVMRIIRKHTHMYIQGVPGGMCQTSGGCSLR